MHSTPHREIPSRGLHLVLLALLTFVLAAAGADAQLREPRENAEEQQRMLDEVLEQGRAHPWTEISGEDVRGRTFWFEYKRRFPYDVVPAGGLKRAIVEMHALRDRMSATVEKSGATLFAANQWQPAGPNNVGGRVRAMAIHPDDPETIYVGAASGGVWKSTDGGLTWRTTFDKQTALTIGSMAIDPKNPNNIYVGTGELRVASDIGFLADGVFKSTDGGETWRNIGLNTLSAVSGIVVHKDNPRIIYLTAGRLYVQARYDGNGLGSARGFYRSTDAGATWTQIYNGDVQEIAVNPENNDELLISTTNSVQRSTNAGASFTPSTTGLQNTSSSIRMSMAHTPSDPSIVWLLQAYRNGSNHSPLLYKSTNGGTSWTAVPTLADNFFRTQGDYNNCISVDPNDPDIILAGGIDLWRSTNAGGSWTNVTNTRGSTFEAEIAHPDQHIIVFDRNVPGLVYIGSDGGVYQSFNSGMSQRRLHASLPITQFHALELDQSRPYRVYGGTQDNQTQGGYGSANGYNFDWVRLLGGDGFWVVVDRTNPDIVYAESQYGNARRIDANNLDAQPVNFIGGISLDEGGWSTPMAMSAVDNRFYTARRRVYRTVNPRANPPVWDTLTPGFSDTRRKATALSLSPLDGTKLIVANDGGDTRFTTNDGVTWARSSGLPSRFPTDLMFDPIVANRVYATFSGFRTGHVFVSNNDGASFTDISSNLPDVPVNAIEIDPTNSSRLFIGTDIGVWVSLDAGNAWFPYNEGLPVSPVADLRIHRTRRALVAATHGRSLFDVSIDNIDLPAVLLAPVGGQTFATPGAITVRWAGIEGPANVFVSYRAGDPFVLVGSAISGGTFQLTVPLVKSTTTRVRVESVAGDKSATSGDLTLTPSANVETLGQRGFIAEAIAMRDGLLWATDRSSDMIRALRLPLLSVVDTIVRSGFSGRIRDLEYDPQAHIFYALVTNDDYTSPVIHRMDTTGAAAGTVTLPASITAVSGIAVAPTGLAVATPGANGRIVVIDVTTGAEVSSSLYAGVAGDWRRGLVWNGTTYTQGVVRADAGLGFPSEIQRLSVTDSARLYEALPVVVSSGNPVYFFDLAVDNTSSTSSAIYFATDTTGTIYRFRGELFSGIITGETSRATTARLGLVTPNPARDRSGVTIALERADDVTLDLVTASGEHAANIFAGRLDEGAHEQRFDVGALASGVYYLVLTTSRGERTMTPLVVTR
ncbi:MAG TPA: hypothetical protein VNA88_04400 [Candidatus Kapabacteria bacterium]|nr:hypothetical protein [Candidatus Kapabacteria bacterium]